MLSAPSSRKRVDYLSATCCSSFIPRRPQHISSPIPRRILTWLALTFTELSPSILPRFAIQLAKLFSDEHCGILSHTFLLNGRGVRQPLGGRVITFCPLQRTHAGLQPLRWRLNNVCEGCYRSLVDKVGVEPTSWTKRTINDFIAAFPQCYLSIW